MNPTGATIAAASRRLAKPNAPEEPTPPDLSARSRTGSVLRQIIGPLIVFNLTVLLSLVLISMRTGRSDPIQSNENPLTVDPASLDFGVVWDDEAFEWDLPVVNISDEIVHVERLEGSCSCTAVAPEQFTISPGETVTVQLILDLTTSDDGDAGELRSHSESIRAFAVDGTNQMRMIGTWGLRGTVRKAFSFNPPVVDFEHRLVAGTDFPEQTVEVTCYRGFEQLLANVTLGWRRCLSKVLTTVQVACSGCGSLRVAICRLVFTKSM